MKRGILLMVLIGLLAGTCQAAITFQDGVAKYDSRAEFLGNTITTGITFDGLAPDSPFYQAYNEIAYPAGGLSAGFVTFSAVADSPPPAAELLGIDTQFSLYGAISSDCIIAVDSPYNGPALMATLPTDIPITAVGAFWGKVVLAPSATQTRITLGILRADLTEETVEFVLPVVSIETGSPHNFFGFSVVGNDRILSVSHDLISSPGAEWAALDDFYYGVVPEPASCIVWSLIALSCLGAGWWRRRKAA